MTTEKQKQIIQPFYKDMPIVSKSVATATGSFGTEPTFFSQLRLTGLSNQAAYPFLPHFEYEITTFYNVKVEDSRIQGAIRSERDGHRFLYQTDNGKVEVFLPTVKDFFDLYNLQKTGSLLDYITSEGAIPEENVEGGFSFRQSSMDYGELTARFPLHTPDVEGLVDSLVTSLDSYSGFRLFKYVQEKTQEGIGRHQEEKFDTSRRILANAGIDSSLRKYGP